MDNPDPLMSVNETATYLVVSPMTVRRLIRAGRLPAVRLNSTLRVRLSAVEQLLAQSTTTATDGDPS